MRTLKSQRTSNQLDKQQGNRIKPVNKGSNVETFQKDTQAPGNVSLKEEKVSNTANSHGETPQRSQTALLVEKSSDVSDNTRGRKRQAEPDPDPGTPNKRRRDSSEHQAVTTEPIKVSEEKNSSQRKRKASTEENSPDKRRRVSETKETISSSSSQEPETSSFHVNTSRDDFEAKYQQLDKIGAGGCGCVYGGIRIADSLPVAIKCIPEEHMGRDLKKKRIPIEVALMQRAAGGPESIGKNAAVSLLDWYYIDHELIIVMERPPSAVSFSKYSRKKLFYDESTAKNFITQIVDAAIDMKNKGVLHRDLKYTNILVEDGPAPRLRIIDFGCGSFINEDFFRSYSGTLSLAPSEWLIHHRYRAGPATVWQIGALLYRMLHGSLFDTMSFLQGKLKFSETKSPDCLDFLQKCFEDEYERATLEQLRLHPWLQ